MEDMEGHRNRDITVRATGMSKSNGEGVEAGCYQRKQNKLDIIRV